MDSLAKQIVFDQSKAVQTGITEYGTKFNQTISVTGANGKVIDVTFAWMKSAKDDVVRLVTAMEEFLSNPDAGNILKMRKGMTDPRCIKMKVG